jgi:hypothetical protein
MFSFILRFASQYQYRLFHEIRTTDTINAFHRMGKVVVRNANCNGGQSALTVYKDIGKTA